MLTSPPPAHDDTTTTTSEAGMQATGRRAGPDGGAHPANDGMDAGKRQRIGRRKPSPDRSTAEWITLAISSLIVGALVALTSYFFLTGSSAPAVIEVEPRPDETFQSGSRFSLPVDVRNLGDATGEDVKVRVTLTHPDGRQETAEWQVQFLSGGGTSHGVAVFGSDPRQGQIEAGVVSYLEP